MLTGLKCMKLFHTRHEGEMEEERFHPMWSLEGCRDIPSTKYKGVGHLCHRELVSSCSLNLSEEVEGRVQWRGLECRVRCGTCGVL